MNFSSLKSYLVAKHLLGNRVSSQIDISRETGVAIGYVNEVVHELSSLDIVKVEYGKCTLLDHVKLLDKISSDRSFKKLQCDEFRLPTSTIDETEIILSKFCESRGIGYAFSVFSALRSYYEYHISYPSIHIYIENLSRFQEIEKGEGVVPVIVLKPDRPDILQNSMRRNGYSVCDRIQVLIDLYASGIGRDAAIRFYRDSIWKSTTF